MTKKQYRQEIKKLMLEMAKINYGVADISELFTEEDKISLNFSKQSNDGYIYQHKHKNTENIYQFNHKNKKNIHQHAHKNDGQIDQQNHKNNYDIIQSIHKNKGNVFQDHHKNKGDIHQEGHTNKSNIFEVSRARVYGTWYEVDNNDELYFVVKNDYTKNGIGVKESWDGDWLATNGFLHYHGYTKQSVIDGLKRKKEHFEKNVEPTIKKIKTNQSISRDDYRKLTGACNLGVKEFCEKHNIPDSQETITLEKLFEIITPADYGYKYVQMFKKEGRK